VLSMLETLHWCASVAAVCVHPATILSPLVAVYNIRLLLSCHANSDVMRFQKDMMRSWPRYVATVL
jgi:hypothetical protein